MSPTEPVLRWTEENEVLGWLPCYDAPRFRVDDRMYVSAVMIVVGKIQHRAKREVVWIRSIGPDTIENASCID